MHSVISLCDAPNCVVLHMVGLSCWQWGSLSFSAVTSICCAPRVRPPPHPGASDAGLDVWINCSRRRFCRTRDEEQSYPSWVTAVGKQARICGCCSFPLQPPPLSCPNPIGRGGGASMQYLWEATLWLGTKCITDDWMGMTQRALFHYVENRNRQTGTRRSYVAVERLWC